MNELKFNGVPIVFGNEIALEVEVNGIKYSGCLSEVYIK